MKTAGIVGALVVVCMAAGVQASSLLNTNLIRNPGAESDAGADGHAVVSPSEWLAGGNITVVNYAAVADSGYFPLSFTGSGDNFFAGGPSNASSIAMQTTDLSAIGSLIDSGHASFTLSGYLGGWSEREDNATLTANFRDAGGESRSVTIGPITGYDRAYQTGFVFCSESGQIPAGTRSVEFVLEMTRVGGGYNSGFADNLSFVMTGQEDPPVNAVPLPAAAWMGMSLLGGLGMLRRRLGRHL